MPNNMLGYIIKFIFHFYGNDLNHPYQDFSSFHLVQYQVYCKASQAQNYLVKRKIRNPSFYSKGAYNSVLAERGGFGPPVPYSSTHAFQACTLNHSDISPK